MATPLRIDYVSDVACPWCALGLASLLKALDRLDGEVAAEIHFHPFELNPKLGPEGENTTEHLAKIGLTPAQMESGWTTLRKRGDALGFDFTYSPNGRLWNTFDAHRLLYWAGLEGKQTELKLALFKANFTDELPINDRDVLAQIADSVGLSGARAREILASEEFTAEVREQEQAWRQRGVRQVPTLVFNESTVLQGGQTPEAFAQIIRDVVKA